MPVENSRVHPTVKIWHPDQVNIYNSIIGENAKIASFVEIGGATIGANCKIEAFAFIPPGSVIEDGVFIGPHVVITNDKDPDLQRDKWETSGVHIKKGAVVCAAVVIAPGVTIGEKAFIGLCSIVKSDVPDGAVLFANSAGMCLTQPMASRTA